MFDYEIILDQPRTITSSWSDNNNSSQPRLPVHLPNYWLAIKRTLCKLFVYQGFHHFRSLAIEIRWRLLFRTTILLHSPDAISESSAIMQVSTTQTQQGISYAASTTRSLRKCLPSHMIQMVRFETVTIHYSYTFQRFKKSEESRLNTNVLPSFWSDLLY